MKRRTYTVRTRRRGGRYGGGRGEDAEPRVSSAWADERGARIEPGAFYSAGPVFGLGRPHRAAPGFANGPDAAAAEEHVAAPTASGLGEPVTVSAYSNGRRISLQGRTDATYDGGSFSTTGVQARRGSGCEGCSGAQCVHVTGTLEATYHVATSVTLPAVPDGLSECQRQRVRDAIQNVLAPHEQEHVRAFQTYNGTTSRPFDLMLCRSAFDGAIRSMFEAEERSRRASAQAASDALDPFNFEVDLDCEDQQQSGTGRSSAGAAPEEP